MSDFSCGGGVEGLPHSGVAIYRPPTFTRATWCEALRTSLARFPLGKCNFENIDISNTQWSAEDFGTLLAILTSAEATAVRLKAFRCKLDDDAVFFLAKWLEQLPVGKLPGELHLSHNEISHGSFEALFKAVDMKAAVLPPRVPVWLRIEGNKLNTTHIQALVEEGRVCLADNLTCGCRVCNKVWQGVPPLFHMRFGLKQFGGSSSTAAALLPPSQTFPVLVAPPQARPLTPGPVPPGPVLPPSAAAAAAAPAGSPLSPGPVAPAPAQPQEWAQARAQQQVASILQAAQSNVQTAQAQKDGSVRAEAKSAAHAAAEEINKRLASLGKEEAAQGQGAGGAGPTGAPAAAPAAAPAGAAPAGAPAAAPAGVPGGGQPATAQAMLAHIRQKREEWGMGSRAGTGGKAAQEAPAAPAKPPAKPADSGRRSPERRPQHHQRAGAHHRSRSPSKKRRARSRRRRSPRRRGSRSPPRGRSCDRSRSAKRRGRSPRSRSAGREGGRPGPSTGAQEAARRKENEQEVIKIQDKVKQLFAGMV